MQDKLEINDDKKAKIGKKGNKKLPIINFSNKKIDIFIIGSINKVNIKIRIPHKNNIRLKGLSHFFKINYINSNAFSIIIFIVSGNFFYFLRFFEYCN